MKGRTRAGRKPFQRGHLLAMVFALALGIAVPAAAAIPGNPAAPNPDGPHSGKQIPGVTGFGARQADPPWSAARRSADLGRGAVVPDLNPFNPNPWHGYWGVFPSEVVYGAQATQSINPNLKVPPDTLFSPTLYPTGAACIEMSTIYNGNGPAIGAFDWCGSKSFAKTVAVDSGFLATYTTTVNGVPAYTVQDVQTDPAANTWTAYLFDYATGVWDTFYTSSGTSGGTNLGWAIDEVYTNYDSATGEGDYCTESYGATWESSAIQYQTSPGGGWFAADPTNSGTNIAYPRGSDLGCDDSGFWLPTANSDIKMTDNTHGSGELVGTGSGKCVDTNGGVFANGTKEQIWDCHNAPGQIWTYNQKGELTTDNGTYCLDATGRGTTSGTKIQLYRCNGGTNQEWTFSIRHTLVGIGSGLCVDVTNYGTADGSQLQLWSCDDTTNQQWTWR